MSDFSQDFVFLLCRKPEAAESEAETSQEQKEQMSQDVTKGERDRKLGWAAFKTKASHK